MIKKDNLIYGIVPGLLVPLVAAMLLYRAWGIGTKFRDFYNISVYSGNLSKLLALGCFVNLGIFYLFLKLEKPRAAQGVIFGTLVYVIVSVYYLFIR